MKYYYPRQKYQYPITDQMHLLKIIIDNIVEIVNQNNILEGKTLVMWCRGSSGAIISGILSYIIPNSVIQHVKKPGETSHSMGRYVTHTKTYNVFVDDFIGTGNTFRAVLNEMELYSISLDAVWVCGYEKSPVTHIENGIFMSGKSYN